MNADRLPRGPCNLQRWARAVVVRWSDRFPEPVRLLAPREPLVVPSDPRRLDEAIDALLHNARRYRVRAVTVSIRRADDRVRIRVYDEGPEGGPSCDAGEFVLSIPVV